MPLRAVSFSMARKTLLKAKPAAEAAIDALFPPQGVCQFCTSKLEDKDFRPVCGSCSQRLLSWFTYERRVPGVYWDLIEGHLAGRIKAVREGAPEIARIIGTGSAAAIAEISRAMATCVPPIRYIRTDGVYLFADGLDSGRATAHKALGKQLARSLACDYRGQLGRSNSHWQQEAMAKYGGANSLPSSAYPVLISESRSVNEAAALLLQMSAKEIIWADADGL